MRKICRIIVILTFLCIVLISTGFYIIGNSESINSNYRHFIEDKFLNIEENINEIEENYLTTIYGNSFVDIEKEDLVKVIYDISLNEVEKRLIQEYNERNKIDVENLIFVGNSLVEGLRLNSGSDNIFLCKIGISLDGLKSEIYRTLSNYSCDTVVIEMGTNELGYYSENHFKESYQNLIDYIYTINSNSKIICLSIPPVSQSKSNSDSNYNNINVKKYNNYLMEICNQNDLIYIDNNEFFGDVLSKSYTGDGIHLNGTKYKEWYDFIILKLQELNEI